MRLLLPVLAVCILTAVGRDAAAQGKTSTKAGIYTREQALRGQDVYAGLCKNCHTPEAYTGSAFTSKWNGKKLSELYVYIRDQMPKNDPGSLSPEEYVDVVAYLLRLNRMPVGQSDLPADSDAMKAIRIETMTLPVRKEK
ncbi:MAG: cytochrome c [Gemmatimonadaceae bacterium]